MGFMGLMGRVAVAALLTGCFTSWVVILLRKLGVLEILQVQGNKFISKLASCDFCLNWWLSWAFALPIGLLTGDVWWFGVPFFSTTIGRWLSA